MTTRAGGLSPGKDNVLDAWGAVDQSGADAFLYLGFAREASQGTTFVTFELNRDARLWDNGRARIACRRTGDLLVSYEARGNDVMVVIERWVTTGTDASTGCATTGRLEEATGVAANVHVQGAVNAASIASVLPGSYTGAVPAERFGEASLDLTRLLHDAFGDECFAFSSIWMHSRSSDSESSALKDYLAPQASAIRTCAASGTKFFDSNADGKRDPGEPGIPRFAVWADYDNDGIRDADEPFAVTDSQGNYVIYDIRPPNGTYALREGLLNRRTATLPVATNWICSYPNAATAGGSGAAPGGRFPCGWGPIDANTTPNARGRDFGNWFPAQLTVEKQLEPVGDPGRFDLLVNGRVVVPAAGDGASVTLTVPPGVYDVSEQPTAGTSAADYRSTVACRRDPTRSGERRPSLEYDGLVLAAGQRASCTFTNSRLITGGITATGAPAIAIRKTGPPVATAGDTLQYTLLVTNPSVVPFPAAAVTDPGCDAPPELAAKNDAAGADASPGTLDPEDTWTYRCSHATSSGGAACEPARIDNTAVVTADTVSDQDAISTILLCPGDPTQPITPVAPPGTSTPQSPGQPGAVAPPGRAVPHAGDAAVAGMRFRAATTGCIRSRVPRLNLTGTRVANVRVYVNGHLRRRLTLQALRRRHRQPRPLPRRHARHLRARLRHAPGHAQANRARLRSSPRPLHRLGARAPSHPSHPRRHSTPARSPPARPRSEQASGHAVGGAGRRSVSARQVPVSRSPRGSFAADARGPALHARDILPCTPHAAPLVISAPTAADVVAEGPIGPGAPRLLSA